MNRGKRRNSREFIGYRLGDLVKMLYGVTDEQLEIAIDVHKQTGERLGKVLVNLQMITIQQLATCTVVLSKNETTLFLHSFAERLRRPSSNHHVQLFLETFFHASIALTVILFSGVKEAGLFALFFTSASLSTSFDPIDSDSNIRSISLDFCLVFVAVFLTYLGAGMLVEPSALGSTFEFAAYETGLGGSAFFGEREVANFDHIFHHNITVACLLFCLSFVFRSYAVLLTICFSAHVWGTVVSPLLSSRFHLEFPGLFAASGLGILGFGPHLLLETIAYVGIALCGLTFSKSLIWYGFFTHLFLDNTKGFVLGIIGPLLLLVLAAHCEVHWLVQFSQWWPG